MKGEKKKREKAVRGKKRKLQREKLSLSVQGRGKINGSREPALEKVTPPGVNRNKPDKLVRLSKSTP